MCCKLPWLFYKLIPLSILVNDFRWVAPLTVQVKVQEAKPLTLVVFSCLCYAHSLLIELEITFVFVLLLLLFYISCARLSNAVGLSTSVASNAARSNRAGTSKPKWDGSTIRSAFCNVYSNVRPIAITSPTLFIMEPISSLTMLNLFKSHRGTFTTM